MLGAFGKLADGGLRSLNGQPWLPGEPLTAKCGLSELRPLLRRASPGHGAADVPAAGCTCGVYASKSAIFLRSSGYDRYGIGGEVYLWGRVVEHENGWRGQFAYPKSLSLSADRFPVALAGVQSRLETLVAYGADIFVSGREGSILLWTPTSGYQTEGLEWLIDRGQQYYENRRQERRLKTGDRVAVAGWGIAIVTAADERQVHAVVGNRNVLHLDRNRVEWNPRNMRWEIPQLRSRVRTTAGP